MQRIAAVVVTYNRKELLRCCLNSLLSQTHPLDEILVVNNASTDSTAEMLAADYPSVKVLSLSENAGSAAGFYEGMKNAYERGFDLIWIMDDDAAPASDCLERLLRAKQPDCVLAPVLLDSSGRHYGIGRWGENPARVTAELLEGKKADKGAYIFPFVGPMFPRSAIEKVGLPDKDFFIWFDDIEYSLRLHRAGIDVVAVPDAIIHHDNGGKPKRARFLWRTRERDNIPPWKNYYGARNELHTLLRSPLPRKELLHYLRSRSKHIVADFLYTPERWQHLHMHLLGAWHGALGRMGKRVEPR